MKLSLIQTVVNLLKERGCGTVDDLHPLLPEFTREQVLRALSNARQAGWLSCDGHQPRKADSPHPRKQGTGVGRGSVPAMYHFKQLPTFKPRAAMGTGKPRKRKPDYRRSYVRRPMVASVFELGSRI
jgi:hypothetical protein